MSDILVLSRTDLAGLMTFADYVEAVAEAFRLYAEGRCSAPMPMELPAQDGAFHIKAACRDAYVAVKMNANFPRNPRRAGLPTIQGVVLLSDAMNGTPLALLDAIEITIQRTGAATAVAARYLAPADATTATICGCGVQGRIQLVALHHALRFRRAFAWDIYPKVAAEYARRMSAKLGIEVSPVSALREATRVSQVIATCTTASAGFLGLEDVRPGTFIAAIGADNPEKSEIRPELMARAKVVGDIREQCATMGDLHHAILARSMTAADLHAELGDLVTGRKRGREHAEEITIFDGTGSGIQDVAAAARAYELARDRGIGSRFSLA